MGARTSPSPSPSPVAAPVTAEPPKPAQALQPEANIVPVVAPDAPAANLVPADKPPNNGAEEPPAPAINNDGTHRYSTCISSSKCVCVYAVRL